MGNIVASLALAAVVLTSCGGVRVDAPTSCGLTGPAGACEQAVAAAEARLGLVHPPIVAISALSGAYFCGEGCTIPRETWWVVFAFSTGDPVVVLVNWVNGVATAGEPRPVPSGMPVPGPPQ